MAISTLSSASSCSRGALAQCLRARSDMVHSVTPRTSVLDLETRSGWLTLPPEPSINRRLDLYVAAFWPSNAALFAAASGSTSAAKDKAELIRLTRQWVAYDWQVLSQLRISGEFIKESCGRRTAAPQGIRSTDPRPPGIGGP